MAWTINNGKLYFNSKLYTGNGGTNVVTGVGFNSDFTWIKNRATTGNHALFDKINGVTKYLNSNNQNGLATSAPTLTAWSSDGFTIGSSTDLNGNGNGIASWNWLANGAGSANTDGDINSTVSANTTSGFSIVTYTGTGSNATIGHGLGAAPSMIIVKDLSEDNYDWMVYHQSLGATKYIRLNLTSAVSTSTVWQDTAPTNQVFSVVSNSSDVNKSGNNFIAYCFANVQGFSKMGSYVGNGSTNGTFIYTGFRPAFAMFKDTTSARDWTMLDNKRNTFNVMDKRLFPNNSDAENDTDILDFTSNGIKLRSTNTSVNVSGNTYIYMAFAENPITSSTGVPSTAR